MATTHDLYLGGGRTANPNTRMFPSARYNPMAVIRAADHKAPVSYALTRVFDPTNLSVTNAMGDAAVREYIDALAADGTPLAVNDILTLVPLPNGCIFDGFYWEVERPLTGFSFSIGYARIGNGSYTPGAALVPSGTMGTVLLSSQSAASAASGFVDSDGTDMAADTPLALKSLWVGGSVDTAVSPDTLAAAPPGDALVLRIDAIPAGTGAAALGSLRLKVSAMVRELVRGQY